MKKDKIKGLARIFKGPKPKEKKRMKELKDFLDNYQSDDKKEGKNYNVKTIIAEMKLFIEDYSQNPEYILEIKRVNELKEVLNNVFSYEREEVEKTKNERRDNIGTTCSKIARIRRLDNDRKEAIQNSKKPECRILKRIEQVYLKDINKANEKDVSKDIDF